MLIQFKIRNFKSIKDEIIFSMVADDEISKNKENTFEFNKQITLLKSVVLYGANASGKTNILSAFRVFMAIVLNEYKIIISEDKIPYFPFKTLENQPTFFEIVIGIKKDKILYRYGFEYNENIILKEWLYKEEQNNGEKLLFIRNKNKIECINFDEGKGFENNTRENGLFLLKCNSENGFISKQILKCLTSYNFIFDNEKLNTTEEIIQNGKFKNDVLDIVKNADFGITDIKFLQKEVRKKDLPKDILEIIELHQKKMKINEIENKKEKFLISDLKIIHKLDGKEIEFNKSEESKGTINLFNLAGPLVEVINNNQILFIDELDSSLHILLVKKIIEFIHSKKNKNAQFIFVTHNVNVMDMFRDDQIYFIDKNNKGSSKIYSLIEFKDLKENENRMKEYLDGRYNAIPDLNKFGEIL
ncbi:AAA family ATPase [Campylobacter lari]|uniref:AAA family ATPase n=1 Tax=Campylobacter lari TaxID=201 RepID=UPI0021C008E2|nr:ATP-binding protein [Campylobacter lari]